ncbi:hypothetical protein [Bacteroides sedimenti]|uniref:Uncharacterized protein n=1 Tax=Bacteroides sedimenti TaxID=2136147 RepID=A0ABM8IEQ1_9BACE
MQKYNITPMTNLEIEAQSEVRGGFKESERSETASDSESKSTSKRASEAINVKPLHNCISSDNAKASASRLQHKAGKLVI